MSLAKAILLTFLLLIIELGVLLVPYIFFASKNFVEKSEHIQGIALIIARVVAYGTVFLSFWKKKDHNRDPHFSKLKPGIILLLVLLIIATELIFRPFLDFDRILLVIKGQELTPYNYSFSGFTARQIYSVIAALLLSPVLEELFFRKLLITELLRKYSLSIALLTSSLLFALIHWETPINLLPSFLFGLLSGFVYFKTRQITYSILLHLFANMASLILAIKGAAYYQWLSWLDFGYLYWTLFIIGLISTFGILKYIVSITNRTNKS